MLTDREVKMDALVRGLMGSEDGRRLLAGSIGRCGGTLLRNIEACTFPAVTDPVRLANARHGIFMDTETTGLGETDRVFQLAMRKFTFDDQGILGLGEVFDRLRDPGMEIPEKVVRLTHITNEMVKGKVLDDAEVAAFIDGTEKFFCHNAGFDRKMVERNFPGAAFDRFDFHCTSEEVEWLLRGHNGRSLELLAKQAGYDYGSHNALNDINVMPYVLSRATEGLGTPFTEMLEKGAQGQILLALCGKTFDHNEALKEKGYRWSPDGYEAGGTPKSWFRMIENDPETLALEADFLRPIARGGQITIQAYATTPKERYSARPAKQRVSFRLEPVRDISDAVRQNVDVQDAQPSFGF
ncbi:exonuclease domain-containing protein [Paracoccus sp. ME4]|uniref:exonuclease domain-containing protein n=1 Tax=Paracoccus sp. ME4 TaxID=3138066 RepID=UPI00398AF5EC